MFRLVNFAGGPFLLYRKHIQPASAVIIAASTAAPTAIPAIMPAETPFGALEVPELEDDGEGEESVGNGKFGLEVGGDPDTIRLGVTISELLVGSESLGMVTDAANFISIATGLQGTKNYL